jgi:hypothetical protein
MTPPLSPLAQVTKASEQTAEAIRAAARLIDEQAGASLPAALAELALACERARQRVDDAREQAAALVAGLLGAFDGLTAETLEGIEHARHAPPHVAPARAPALEPPAPEAAPVEATEEAPLSGGAAPAKRLARASGAGLPRPLAGGLPGGPASARDSDGNGRAPEAPATREGVKRRATGKARPDSGRAKKR